MRYYPRMVQMVYEQFSQLLLGLDEKGNLYKLVNMSDWELIVDNNKERWITTIEGKLTEFDKPFGNP